MVERLNNPDKRQRFDVGLDKTPISNSEPYREHKRAESAEEWKQKMMASGYVPTPGDSILSRRTFLTGGAAFAAGGLTTDYFKGYTLLGRFLNDTVAGQYDYDEVVKEAKQFLKERFHVDLFVGLGKHNESFTGDPAVLEKYKTTLRVIVDEITKYPPKMIQKIGERRGFDIRAIAKLGLKSGDDPSQSDKHWTGFAPWLTKSDAAQLLLHANETESQQRVTFHHELNHRCAEKWQKKEDRDKKWIALHGKISARPYREIPKGERHGASPKEHFFLSNYSGTRPIEDQAVCAECMMIPRLHLWFLKRIQEEQEPASKQILTAKYNTVKQEYFLWSEGEIAQSFWDAIIKQGLHEAAEKKRRN